MYEFCWVEFRKEFLLSLLLLFVSLSCFWQPSFPLNWVRKFCRFSSTYSCTMIFLSRILSKDFRYAMVKQTQIMIVKTKGNYKAMKDFLGPNLAVTELDEKMFFGNSLNLWTDGCFKVKTLTAKVLRENLLEMYEKACKSLLCHNICPCPLVCHGVNRLQQWLFPLEIFWQSSWMHTSCLFREMGAVGSLTCPRISGAYAPSSCATMQETKWKTSMFPKIV